MRNKIIGILGGMGPDASAYMYKLLITMAQKEFCAKANEDFPEIILYSIPVPDLISSKNNEKFALRMLKDKVKKLNEINVSFLTIACNTVHILIPELQKESKAEFISIIEEVVKKINKEKIRKVGILATPSTINSKLYQDELEKYQIQSIVPNSNQLKLLDRIIRNVLAGKTVEKDKGKLIDIADSLRLQGAKGIIIGCTELPLIFPSEYSTLIYNSVEILSTALLRKYYKSNTID